MSESILTIGIKNSRNSILVDLFLLSIIMQHISTQLQTLHELENSIALTHDAVIHKAMQETLEFIEALGTGSIEEIISESGDAISNIMSSVLRVHNSYQYEVNTTLLNKSELELAIQIGKRNDAIQKYR